MHIGEVVVYDDDCNRKDHFCERYMLTMYTYGISAVSRHLVALLSPGTRNAVCSGVFRSLIRQLHVQRSSFHFPLARLYCYFDMNVKITLGSGQDGTRFQSTHISKCCSQITLCTLFSVLHLHF